MRFFRFSLSMTLACLISSAWGQEKPHVLLLNSYHYGLTWADDETAGIRDVLEKSGTSVELHVEYMDTKRVSDATQLLNLHQLLCYKYRNTHFSSILVNDNDAFEFLKQHRSDKIFAGIPVIFAGVNFFRQEMLAGFSGFTGVAETFEVGQTIGLMQKLHPGVRRIVVIIDPTITGLAIRRDLEPMLEPYAVQIDFEFWDKLSLPEIRRRLPLLGKDTLVLLLPFARDSAGTFISFADMAEMVSRLSAVPIYGVYDFYIGYGIVGGRLTSGSEQGRAAANILLRVLKGENPDNIPVMTVAPSEFQFDSRQLHRYHIDAASLPEGSRILFQSWYELYRVWVWSGGGMLLIVLLLGWGWGRAYRFKRRSEKALRESEAKLRTVLDCSSNAIFLVGANGEFTFGNRQAEVMLGYSGDELLQMGIPDTLVPEELPRVMRVFERNLTGEQESLEATLLRKDGARIIVEINGVLLPGGEVLGELRDITQRKLTEEAVRRSRDQLTAILNSTTESIFHIDGDGIILAINDIAAHRLKNQPKDMIGKNVFDFFPADVASSRRENIAEVMRTGREKYTEDIRNNRFYSLNYYPVIDSDGKVGSVVVYAADISERKKVETELGIAATAFEVQEGMLVTDADRVMIRVNWAFTAITGYASSDVIGKRPKLLSSGRHDANFYSAMWKSINETGTWAGEIWNRRKNGEIYPVHLTITAVRDQSGQTSNYVAAFSDITEIKSAEEKIKNLAFYDSLTGLPNRRLLQDRLQQALSSRMRTGREGALLFIDLDNFKTLNDTLGHGVGDLLLQQVAQRLVACVREGDTVARLGGDEFVVMLEDMSVQAIEAAEQAEVIGVKILSSLNQTYQLDQHEFHSTSSIGATLFGEHQSIETLLQQADIAMYEAKKAGRNSLRFFDPGMQEVINERAVMESELRVALESRQFELYYQVQVDSAHRAIGAEALIRWNHPERGMISPALFIPLAEDTGAILPIGHWVLEAACAQLKRWQEDVLMNEVVLAVNVSAKQFRQPGFVAQVQEVVTRYGIRPMQLKIELTESVVLKDVDDTIDKMKILKAFGVSFSMDDFGTGYSSLQYLKRLPLDQLKIDQSFVRDIATDSNDKSIVKTIIAMAKGMNLDVIAEGVETEEQRQFLEITGCCQFQGYLFSRPVPIEQFEALLGRV